MQLQTTPHLQDNRLVHRLGGMKKFGGLTLLLLHQLEKCKNHLKLQKSPKNAKNGNFQVPLCLYLLSICAENRYKAVSLLGVSPNEIS